MNEYFRLHGKLELNKRQDTITKALVDEECANGRTTLPGDEEPVELEIQSDP